jgi:hypothetical protein
LTQIKTRPSDIKQPWTIFNGVSRLSLLRPAAQQGRDINNISALDRLLRALLGVALLEVAFFWLTGAGQMAAYVLGGILGLTAAIGFSPLYRVLGLCTARRDSRPMGRTAAVLAGVVLVALALAGAYASNFLTRKLFLEDFSAMNNHYKQTLFLTGRNERERAVSNYENLLLSYRLFREKYDGYLPYALRGDGRLNVDLDRVSEILTGVGTLVRSGDLHQAHIDLEKVRPVFQEIFKRNGFSVLAVALVDFHDAMEGILDAANAKDHTKVISLYPQASEILKIVEAEENDSEIQAIRRNLNDLFAMAKGAQLAQMPAKGDELKSSFVKVYLKRG